MGVTGTSVLWESPPSGRGCRRVVTRGFYTAAVNGAGGERGRTVIGKWFNYRLARHRGYTDFPHGDSAAMAFSRNQSVKCQIAPPTEPTERNINVYHNIIHYK